MYTRMRFGVDLLAALCLLAAACERSQPTTSPYPNRSQRFSLDLGDSVSDVPGLQIALPPRVRPFDTSDAVLEADIRSVGGLAFVAFKSPSAARTFQAGGHRAAVPATVVREALSATSRPGVQLLRFYALSGMVYARLDSGTATLLRHDSLVDWVEPDIKPVVQPPLGPPVPPLMGKARSVVGAANLQSMPWNISLVNAPPAWSLSTGVNAKTMIFSGGVGNDPDLPTIPSQNCGGYLNACGDSVLWPDGTLMAGITYARDSIFSIVGVAPGLAASNIYSWSFWSDYYHFNWSMLFSGIGNGVARGVRTMLLDYGHYDFNSSEQLNIEAAISANVTVVTGVGILGQYDSAYYPASYPNVIGVSGVRPDGIFAGAGTCPVWTTGSDYGPMVKLAAPISGVTTFGHGLYYDLWWLGPECHTKLAAAHVAGAAALLNDLHPGWTPAQVTQALTATASGGGTRINDYYGYGLLNAAAAVQYVPPPPPPPPLGVAITGSNLVPARHYCTWYAGAWGGTEPYSYAWTENGSPAGNGSDSLWIKTPSSNFTVAVKATDANGLNASASLSVAIGGTSCNAQ